jgi:hypothetical protein
LLQSLEADNRQPEVGEKRTLARYTGWGHSPQVFDELKAGYWQAHLEGEYSYGYRQDEQGLTNWADKFFEHHQRLKELLTPEEWSRAEVSILNAHYTSREVIEHGLWAIAKHLEFAGGRVLENSAGIGHVIGLVPEHFAADCRFTACELDSVTGRMLAMLYPQSRVHVMGFQDAKIPANSQDLIVGNFPFNREGWGGDSADRYPFALHDQFFARSLDLTVPGGLIVAISTAGTLDSSTSTTFRRWINQRAELIGAIRLPNNTFVKNAGTEVTTDIVIFRKKDGRPLECAETFVNAMPMETGRMVDDAPETVEVNEYYHRHPDMMLGRMSREGTMYEADAPALIAHPGMELVPQLHEAVSKLPQGIAGPREAIVEVAQEILELAESHHKEGSYQIVNNEVRQVRGGALSPPDFGEDILLNNLARIVWVAL